MLAADWIRAIGRAIVLSHSKGAWQDDEQPAEDDEDEQKQS